MFGHLCMCWAIHIITKHDQGLTKHSIEQLGSIATKGMASVFGVWTKFNYYKISVECSVVLRIHARHSKAPFE